MEKIFIVYDKWFDGVFYGAFTSQDEAQKYIDNETVGPVDAFIIAEMPIIK